MLRSHLCPFGCSVVRGDSKYRTNMKYKDLRHASTAPEYCCLLSITAIAHKAFCLRKPEEMILDPSDAADHRSVIQKSIPVVAYYNGKSCLTHFELSSCLLIALRRVVYTQAPTMQSRTTKDCSLCSLCGLSYPEQRSLRNNCLTHQHTYDVPRRSPCSRSNAT